MGGGKVYVKSNKAHRPKHLPPTPPSLVASQQMAYVVECGDGFDFLKTKRSNHTGRWEGCVNFGNAAIFTHSEGVITISVFTSRETAGQVEV